MQLNQKSFIGFGSRAKEHARQSWPAN